MNNNATEWSKYAEEYNINASFSAQRIHTGLGLAGIAPLDVVNTSHSILDVGCGTGINTALLSKHTDGKVIGIDPVASQIQIARKNYVRDNLEFLCCDFQNLPKYITDNYDLITFFGSLDYISIDDIFFDIGGSQCRYIEIIYFWNEDFTLANWANSLFAHISIGNSFKHMREP